MDTGTMIVTSVTFATLAVEGIKQLVKFAQKKFGVPQTDLPMKFYYFLLPVLAFASEPLMAFLGWTEYSIPSDWQGWVLELVRVSITSLASVLLYENSIVKLKEAKAERESLG